MIKVERVGVVTMTKKGKRSSALRMMTEKVITFLGKKG